MTADEKKATIRFTQTRSFRGCISDSWKIFALHTKDYLKFLWLHALLAGTGFALFLFLLTRFYVSHFLPTKLYTEMGMECQTAWQLCKPNPADYLLPAISLLLLIVTFYLFKGASVAQIRFYAVTDSLPACGPFSLWKEIRASACRNLLFDSLTTIAYLLPAAIIAAIAWLTTKWVWGLPLLIPTYIYIWVTATIGRQYFLVERLSLKKSFNAATRNGIRSFGGYLLILMLTVVPFIITSLIFILPVTLFPLSAAANGISTLTGNATGLPEYHSAIFISISALAFTVCSLSASIRRWSLSLKTASDKTQTETDKKRDQKETTN